MAEVAVVVEPACDALPEASELVASGSTAAPAAAAARNAADEALLRGLAEDTSVVEAAMRLRNAELRAQIRLKQLKESVAALKAKVSGCDQHDVVTTKDAASVTAVPVEGAQTLPLQSNPAFSLGVPASRLPLCKFAELKLGGPSLVVVPVVTLPGQQEASPDGNTQVLHQASLSSPHANQGGHPFGAKSMSPKRSSLQGAKPPVLPSPVRTETRRSQSLTAPLQA